jgi:hypothetical protein
MVWNQFCSQSKIENACTELTKFWEKVKQDQPGRIGLQDAQTNIQKSLTTNVPIFDNRQ